MKLFLFVALFAVSASALSLDAISAGSWADEIQDIYDCVNALTLEWSTNSGYSLAAVKPQHDADKNFQTVFLMILDAKYEDYDISALAKVKAIFKDKWDTLQGTSPAPDAFADCFKALIPSLVEEALESAKDKSIDEDAIVTLIKKYLDELKEESWSNSETVDDWKLVVEGTATGNNEAFVFSFNSYVGVAMDENIRDSIRDTLTGKATNMQDDAHSSERDQFYELMKLSVRGALKEAIKAARDVDATDLRGYIDQAILLTATNPKTQADYLDDELDKWAAAIMTELNKQLLTAHVNPCAIELIMEMFEPKVECAAAVCNKQKFQDFLNGINAAATDIATDMVTAWDEVKDELAPIQTTKKCKTPAVTPSAAPAPASTPCVSPNSWSNRRPATNWWNC